MYNQQKNSEQNEKSTRPKNLNTPILQYSLRFFPGMSMLLRRGQESYIFFILYVSCTIEHSYDIYYR